MLPAVNAEAMSLHLAEISRHVAADGHAVVILDQAGWHGAKALRIPDNLSLLPLPPYSPELNPVENLWQFLGETGHQLGRLVLLAHLVVDAEHGGPDQDNEQRRQDKQDHRHG